MTGPWESLSCLMRTIGELAKVKIDQRIGLTVLPLSKLLTIIDEGVKVIVSAGNASESEKRSENLHVDYRTIGAETGYSR